MDEEVVYEEDGEGEFGGEEQYEVVEAVEKGKDEEVWAQYEEEVVKKDPRDDLTDQQKVQYMSLFRLLTGEKTNVLRVKDAPYILRTLGVNPRQDQIEDLLEELDPRNMGTMDYPTFLLLMCRLTQFTTDSAEEVIAAFRVLDKSDSGRVRVDELEKCLTTMGDMLDYEEAATMVKLADVYKTGNVDYAEFVTRMFREKPAKRPDKKKGKKK